MALLEFGDELARARTGAPFANGYEGESWMSLWCQDCTHRNGCPLLDVALFGRTPAAWQLREPDGLNRYTCEEHQEIVNESTEELL